MSPTRIETATFRFVAQHLNHCATAVPGMQCRDKNSTISMLVFMMMVLMWIKKVKWSRYWPSVVQRVDRGIALLFYDRGTRRGWVVSSTPRPQFTPGKDSVPIIKKAVWVPGPVWTGRKSRPHRDSIPNRPARSQSLYRLSYPAHIYVHKYIIRIIIIIIIFIYCDWVFTWWQ